MESETIEATKPMNARRKSQTKILCSGGEGMVVERKLYCRGVSCLSYPKIPKHRRN